MTTFSTSRKGEQKLYHCAFIHSKHRADEEKTTWRCERFKTDPNCNGRPASVNPIFSLTHCYNHLPSIAESQAVIVISNIKQTALSSHDAPRTVINEYLAETSDAVIVTLPKIIQIHATELQLSYRRDFKIGG